MNCKRNPIYDASPINLCQVSWYGLVEIRALPVTASTAKIVACRPPSTLQHQHQHHLLFHRGPLSARLLPLLRVMRMQLSHSLSHITWQLTVRALPWPYQPCRYHFGRACVKLPHCLCLEREQFPGLGRPDLPMKALTAVTPSES